MPEPVGPIVRTPAVLRSLSGTVAGCVLETWKERASTGKMYTGCRIVNDPPDLPDGNYIVEFGANRIQTRRVWGVWSLTFLAPDIAA